MTERKVPAPVQYCQTLSAQFPVTGCPLAIAVCLCLLSGLSPGPSASALHVKQSIFRYRQATATMQALRRGFAVEWLA